MSVVFLLGAVQAFFLAFVLIFNRHNHRAGKFLNVWIFFLGIQLTGAFLGASGFYRTHPQYFGYDSSLVLLQGPFLYLYVLLVLNKLSRLKPILFLHAIPFIFFTTYFVYKIHSVESPDLYQHIVNFLSDPSNIIIHVFGLFAHLHLIIYLILAIRLLRIHIRELPDEFSYTEGVNLKWLQNVINGITVIAVIIILGLLINDLLNFTTHDFKAYMIYSAFAALPFYLSFFAIQQKIVYPFQNEKEVPKYESSGLTREESKKIAESLIEFMHREKPYLNPKLSIKDLSSGLKIHPKRLSQIINENFNENFFNFINRYRVEEFIKRVKDKKYNHFTLLAIGLDCGFNTKSSFNSIFKRVTGKTPSEYKEGTSTDS